MKLHKIKAAKDLPALRKENEMDYALYLLIRIVVAFSHFTKLIARMHVGSYEEWRPGKKLKVLLAGYNGAQNTGSDVRVAEIARQLKRIYGKDHIQITVMVLDTESVKGCFDSAYCLL